MKNSNQNTILLQWNTCKNACDPGENYWVYYPDALLLDIQVTAIVD